mmetsp:Transcript_34496/g.55569  ORF Transcript_34496/g.55569 Transcript_34496/m.55569 type:complete len:258 (-) Transcript_34496:476-1249(-)
MGTVKFSSQRYNKYDSISSRVKTATSQGPSPLFDAKISTSSASKTVSGLEFELAVLRLGFVGIFSSSSIVVYLFSRSRRFLSFSDFASILAAWVTSGRYGSGMSVNSAICNSTAVILARIRTNFPLSPPSWYTPHPLPINPKSKEEAHRTIARAFAFVRLERISYKPDRISRPHVFTPSGPATFRHCTKKFLESSLKSSTSSFESRQFSGFSFDSGTFLETSFESRALLSRFSAFGLGVGGERRSIMIDNVMNFVEV